MEHIVAMSEGEWNNLSGMYSPSTKEADFMAQLLGNSSIPNELSNCSSLSWQVPSNMNMVSIDEQSSMYTSEENPSNIYYYSQEGFYPSDQSHHHHHHQTFLNNNNPLMDYLMVDTKNSANNVMEGDDYLNQDLNNDSLETNENLQPDQSGFLQLGIEHEIKDLDQESSPEEKIMICPLDISKKRSRIPIDVQKNKRNVKPRKNQRLASSSNDDEEKTGVYQRQNSMSCCSEDDSNGSQELNVGVASTSTSKCARNGKTRASRGSATDPQSLYARKRRERINERLRILQNLVPNGTKVDISTMLEEAVQYVKFLQLQIKLLSSDDLWMYAPIAYNGMDMGLDLKIATHNL